MTTNETITLCSSMGLEIDFSRIEYKDPNFNGPHWLVANIPANEIRTLCGKDGTGYFSVTEDEVEIALIDWLAKNLKGEVVSFLWLWDTYRVVKAA
ncbi:MAG: hypothetical protein J6Q22_09600 [Prevotella sp.]|nr:hypothetical protein [Prevotella sp.]